MTAYYFRWPGVAAAMSLDADNEKEARQRIRRTWFPEKKRLPAGFEIWPLSEAEKRLLAENHRQHQKDLPGWARGPL